MKVSQRGQEERKHEEEEVGEEEYREADSEEEDCTSRPESAQNLQVHLGKSQAPKKVAVTWKTT